MKERSTLLSTSPFLPLWETLQSRLPVWFALNGVTMMEQANAALLRFIKEFNRRFHRKAGSSVTNSAIRTRGRAARFVSRSWDRLVLPQWEG
jgi:hypothetical protein